MLNELFKDFEIIEIPPTEEDRQKDQFDYWQRFSEAEEGGIDVIRATFAQIIAECHRAERPIVNLTELYIVANHKVWQYRKTNIELARYYNDMQYSGWKYITENFKGEDLEYFYIKTD